MVCADIKKINCSFRKWTVHTDVAVNGWLTC